MCCLPAGWLRGLPSTSTASPTQIAPRLWSPETSQRIPPMPCRLRHAGSTGSLSSCFACGKLQVDLLLDQQPDATIFYEIQGCLAHVCRVAALSPRIWNSTAGTVCMPRKEQWSSYLRCSTGSEHAWGGLSLAYQPAVMELLWRI